MNLLAGILAAASVFPRAYSHNDYWRGRPLFDALDRGFCSVEADIHLIGGELRVGHKKQDTKPGVTLETLYLDPLLARIRAGGGKVYPSGEPFTLFIDIKTDAEPTYAALRPVLQRYSEMLTSWRGARSVRRAVTVVISGNLPKRGLKAESVRYASLEGTLMELESKDPLYTVIGVDWKVTFTWLGLGPIAREEMGRLRWTIERAHARGRGTHFWDAPETDLGYLLMWQEGSDYINTDDLDGLRRFLQRVSSRPTPPRAPLPRPARLLESLPERLHDAGFAR